MVTRGLRSWRRKVGPTTRGFLRVRSVLALYLLPFCCAVTEWFETTVGSEINSPVGDRNGFLKEPQQNTHEDLNIHSLKRLSLKKIFAVLCEWLAINSIYKHKYFKLIIMWILIFSIFSISIDFVCEATHPCINKLNCPYRYQPRAQQAFSIQYLIVTSESQLLIASPSMHCRTSWLYKYSTSLNCICTNVPACS